MDLGSDRGDVVAEPAQDRRVAGASVASFRLQSVVPRVEVGPAQPDQHDVSPGQGPTQLIIAGNRVAQVVTGLTLYGPVVHMN